MALLDADAADALLVGDPLHDRRRPTHQRRGARAQLGRHLQMGAGERTQSREGRDRDGEEDDQADHRSGSGHTDQRRHIAPSPMATFLTRTNSIIPS